MGGLLGSRYGVLLFSTSGESVWLWSLDLGWQAGSHIRV